MEKADIRVIVNAHWKIFTTKERKVAEYTLNFPEKVVYMTITELSDELKVGEGTIVRFCQKLGFSGFHPFKIALAKSLQNEPVSAKDDLISKLAHEHMQVIQETSNLLKRKDVEKAAGKIIVSRRVYLIGVGASGITALDAFYKFLRIGIDVRFNMDSHLMAMWLAESSTNDCLLAFSQSGSTSVVVDMVSSAKKNGTFVIAVTSYTRSPLTEYADIILLTPTKETPFQSGAIRSKIAQLHVLEVLFEMVRSKLGSSAEEAIARTASAVEKWIY
ncbi:MAG TPA: MurR/RpiR family transcriptional regulator [Thermotogae bacterium]|nr:MurR/RpiR family transcriptional regulator [Thermotogota bacterium]